MDNGYLALSLAATFILHLPFGFMGVRYKRFSRQWGRCLYIPIVLTIALRRVAVIGYTYIPLFIVAAMVGQIAGRRMGRLYLLKDQGTEKIANQQEIDAEIEYADSSSVN